MNDGINDMVRDLKLIKYILIYVELHLIQIDTRWPISILAIILF